MIKNRFIFGNVSSDDAGLIIDRSGVFTIPERDVEKQEVAGKNGDLLFDNKRYKNITISYKCQIHDFQENYGRIRNLFSKVGYHRLEDTYYPNHFRIGRLSGNIEPEIGPWMRFATFTISFDCKPQMWLKSGENPVTFTSDGILMNPTDFEARPLIRVYGTGDLMIGKKTITISKADEYTDLDCDIEDAYKGLENCNSNVSITGYDFPVLTAGETGIRLGKGITKVEIKPRWWTL